MRPTLAFLVVWVILGAVAHLAGWTRGEQGRLIRDALVMVPQLLWFVGIYLGIAAFAPAMLRLHRRAGLWAVLGLVVAAGLVDLIRFGAGIGLVGNLNFALVWLALHQLGFSWRDGRLTTQIAWLLFGGGAVGLIAAVTLGPYPVSMVGLPGDEISNMAPPSFALLCQGLALIGAAALLRGTMRRVLERPRVWRAVVVAGAFAMTAFLWHLTALLLTILAARVLGIGLPEVGTASWWWSRPLWFLVLAVPTALLVALFVRFDAGPKGARGIPTQQPRWVDPLAVLGVLLTVFGILMVSIVGVDVLGNRPQFFLVGEVTPAVSFGVLVAGLALLYAARSPESGSGSVAAAQSGPPR